MNQRQTTFAATIVAVFTISANLADAGDNWSDSQIDRLPPRERQRVVHLFNGKDFDGWTGNTDMYFSVSGGEIVARNDRSNAPKASTYLATEKKYRNFRLIFESRLVTSEMHSGIALWGELVERSGDPFSYKGHLVMFPSNYGYYDLYRRNSIYRDDGTAKRAGKQHDWNRMEILAIGSRIRHVINGMAVADWTDPKPELCQAGPIGLQLHSNKVPQEVRFRGLVLVEDPEDVLVTVADGKPAEATGGGSQIAKRMEAFVDEKQISGAVTLVARDGKIIHQQAVGQADIDHSRPMKKDSIFAIASMTKPVTATAVMILQDEGKLSIDDAVAKYIPEFKDVRFQEQPPKREMTIRDLLTHTSGLVGSQQNTGSLAETARSIAARPLGFEPGEKWQYSPGITVCGRIVEIVSGQAFDKFLADRIFKPLDMKDTTFFPNQSQVDRIVRLYKPGKEKGTIEATDHWLTELGSQRTPNPSGGLFSTAADMARFYQAILNGGELDGKRIVSAKAVRQMTTPQTGDLVTGFTPGNCWGLGWCIVRKPQGVTATVSPGTFGHGGAFGTQGWVDPKRKTVFVLMIQRTGFGNSDGADIRGEFHRLAVEQFDEAD